MSVRLLDLQLIYGVAGAREKFEEVCTLLIRYKYPETRGIRVYKGDGGVDAYVGEWGESGNLHVFQVKFFPTELGDGQKKQIRESLKTCLANKQFNTVKWTLCLPRDLSQDETTWFNNWKRKAGGNTLTSDNIDYWGETELLELLLKSENRGIKEHFFKEEHLTQIREIHEVLKTLLDDISLRITKSIHDTFREQKISRSVFQTAEQFYQPFLNADRLFHHTLPLIGRTNHLKALTEFCTSDKQVALLSGPDGIGKSRLLLEAMRQSEKMRKDLKVLMLCSVYTASNGDELSDGQLLIGVDDALTHDIDSLDELFKAIRTRQDRVKLVLSIRQESLKDVKQHLVSSANFQFGEILELSPLHQIENSFELAKAILGQEDLQRIYQLITLASDSPLIMVLAGGLLKRGTINSSILALSHDDFRQEVLLRYQQTLPTNTTFPIPNTTVQRVRELLYALGPFDTGDTALVTKAATFLEITTEQLIETLELLVKAGMVLCQRERYSSVPDALAYLLLEQACFFDSGRVKAFGPRLAMAFTEHGQTHVLKRLAEIDLRRGKGQDSGLLTEFWKQQNEKYRTGSIEGKINILSLLEDVAYFQPKAALDIVQLALNDQSSQAHVKHYLPGILKQVAHHNDHMKSALNLLWSLGKEDESNMSKQNNHPHQIFQELSKQRVGQVVAYQESFLACIETWCREKDAFSREFTPLDIIPNFLARDGYDDYYFPQTHSLHMQPFYVLVEPTKHMRKQAIQLIASIVVKMDENPKLQFHAIEVLCNIILRGLPFNNDPQLHILWYEEDQEILMEISNLLQYMKSPYIMYQIEYKLRLALKHPENEPIAESIHEALEKIPGNLDIEVIWLLLQGKTAQRFSRHGVDESEISEQELSTRNVAVRLLQKYPTAQELKDKISDLTAHLALFGQKIVYTSFFVSLAEQNVELTSKLCDLIIADPSCLIVDCFDCFIAVIRDQDKGAYLMLIEDALQSEHSRLRLAAVYALCASTEPTIEESATIIRLINDADPAVATRAIQVIERLPEKEKEQAFITLNEVSITSQDAKKVNAICQVLLQHMSYYLSWNPVPFMSSFLQKCVILPELSEHEYFSLCSFLFQQRWKYTHIIASFCIERVKFQKALPEENQHHYNSVMFLPRLANADTANELENESTIQDQYNVLCTIRDEFFASEDEEYVYIFAYFANGYDATALRSLTAWRGDSDEKKMRLIARLIRKAPHSFIFTNETFVEKLLIAADAISINVREHIINALLGCAMSLPFAYMGLPDQPRPEHLHLREKAQEKAEKYPSDSILYEFYMLLGKEAEYRIEMSRSSERMSHSV